MIVYKVDPIDNWVGWHKPADIFRPAHSDEYEMWLDQTDWVRDWKIAQSLAREIGWEGDVREGPFITVVPGIPSDYGASPFIIGWKQDNNGTTFLASPFELLWLDTGENPTTWVAGYGRIRKWSSNP